MTGPESLELKQQRGTPRPRYSKYTEINLAHGSETIVRHISLKFLVTRLADLRDAFWVSRKTSVEITTRSRLFLGEKRLREGYSPNLGPVLSMGKNRMNARIRCHWSLFFNGCICYKQIYFSFPSSCSYWSWLAAPPSLAHPTYPKHCTPFICILLTTNLGGRFTSRHPDLHHIGCC